jgi:4a-hydroxytetrahydrobiopterin dehydratase
MTMTDQELLASRCVPCEGNVFPLEETEVTELLRRVPNWSRCATGPGIERTFRFGDYPSSLLFVNAVAWMAERENHHPYVELGYKQCVVRYHTHALNALSQNDFVCAAKVDAIFG